MLVLDNSIVLFLEAFVIILLPNCKKQIKNDPQKGIEA